MTVGEYPVAPGVRIYEQFRDGAQVAVPLSSLDHGPIPQNQITGVHMNSSDIVDVIILNNATGDAYTYGRMVGDTTVTTETVVNDDGTVSEVRNTRPPGLWRIEASLNSARMPVMRTDRRLCGRGGRKERSDRQHRPAH